MEYMEKYAGIVHGQDHGRVRWKSTWWRVRTHKALHAVHVGVPDHGVDAAGCKSVGYTGGTWDIFTNCHLFVLHGNICDISSFSMLSQILWRI